MAPIQQDSAFLRLPAEIRNQIYQYSLGGELFNIYCWRRYTPFSFATRTLNKQQNFLALLAVCHQIYTETRLLPFKYNAFRFKSQDAFKPWLDTFSVDQGESIREVHIVTWMARNMLEGEGWKLKSLDEVFPVQDLLGLRRVEVEVRMKGTVKHCVKAECVDCGEHDDKITVEEEKVRRWLVSCNKELIVEFRWVMA